MSGKSLSNINIVNNVNISRWEARARSITTEIQRTLSSEASWHQPVIIKKSAKQAGVSEVAPYKHFKDKQCLIAAIAEQGFQNQPLN